MEQLRVEENRTEELCQKLRQELKRGASIRELLIEIKKHHDLKTNNRWCFLSAEAFNKAFKLNIRHVKDLSKCVLFGGTLIDDCEMERQFREHIERARSRWEIEK